MYRYSRLGVGDLVGWNIRLCGLIWACWDGGGRRCIDPIFVDEAVEDVSAFRSCNRSLPRDSRGIPVGCPDQEPRPGCAGGVGYPYPVADSVQRALRVIPLYAVAMIGEEQSPETQQADSVTPAEMAAALEAVRASSPELSQAIDAAGVTPDSLASAHDAAAREEEQ